MKLSAVIITFNEERNIARCLDSLQDVADEILVVDSYSTDQTKSICLQYKVRFLENNFEGHIQQKNYAMNQAGSDMILSLDADEALSDELKKSIQEIKNDKKAEQIAFAMNRRTNYCGQWIYHSGWYPDRKIRLWNRLSGEWGGVNPHDKVVLDSNVKIVRLKGDLLHYSFYSIDEHIAQINKFTTISALEMVERPKSLVLLKMIFSPGVRFFRDYFLKSGFRDGLRGYIICRNAAYSRFLRYAKLYQLILEQQKGQKEKQETQ
ncbi:MAG: glycosyltransferase family 2 protein [Bacteroidales bacterium]